MGRSYFITPEGSIFHKQRLVVMAAWTTRRSTDITDRRGTDTSLKKKKKKSTLTRNNDRIDNTSLQQRVSPAFVKLSEHGERHRSLYANAAVTAPRRQTGNQSGRVNHPSTSVLLLPYCKKRKQLNKRSHTISLNYCCAFKMITL